MVIRLRSATLAVIVALSLAAPDALAQGPPSIAAGKVDPVIDGELTAQEWSGATTTAAFMHLGGPLAFEGTTCHVGHADGGLAVGWKLEGEPTARERGHDGEAWKDDAVELFLQRRASGPVYHLVVNAAGDCLDERDRDPAWDCGCDVAVGRGPGGWQVELLVPWAALGGPPADGEQWRVNFCRDIPDRGLALSWAPLQTSFHESERFGSLRLVDGPIACGIDAIEQGQDHSLRISARAGDGRSVTAVLLRAEDEVAAARARERTTLRLPVAEPGEYTMRLVARVAEEEVLRQEVPVMRRPPLELTLRKRLLERPEVTVTVDAGAAREVPDTYRITVAEQTATVPASEDHPRRAERRFDLADAARGEIPVRVEAFRAGKLLAEARESFLFPPTPDWVGSRIGASDTVPEPWTPVRVQGDVARCWGRTYDFGGRALPARIVTAGEQVLTGPIRLESVAGGRHQLWRDVELRWTDVSDDVALGMITAQADQASFSARVRCEFDGLMHFEIDVSPLDQAAIERVTLEIPLHEQNARYLHLADCTWGGSVSTGLPAEGWRHHFMPFVWLGDEERGVQWFAESDAGWRPRDPDAVIAIDRAGDTVTLRLRMVEEALEPGEPFRTSFGLQATPVKPIPPESRQWHITHGGFYGMEDLPASATAHIAWDAAGRIRLDRGTVEMWVKPLFDPGVRVERSPRAQFNRELFKLQLANGDHLGFYWNIDDRSMRAYSRVGGEVRLVVTSSAPEPWSSGEWHHVALTWGEQARIFIDGQQVASRQWDGSLEGTLEGARIILGSAAQTTPCEFAVDTIRISDIAREIPPDPALELPSDEYTLLRDAFEGLAATEGRELFGGEQLALVEGLDGRAVAIGPPDRRITLLDHLQRRGVNTLVIHEQWTEIQAYGSTKEHRERLRSLVEACHERGIRLLVYFGYELSDAAPEWELYRDEVLVHPRRGGYQRRDIPQTAYTCCYASAWKEYILTSIARMIDEFDIDGVYLDGTTEPFGCRNELHGCGYVSSTGERRQTWPIFEVRDLMRRMRDIVKSRKPDGLISAHMSATVSMPTLSFVDSYWDGEQLDVEPSGFRLPLDAFRAEFMGHNWGMPAEFLCYRDRPFSYREAMALALLHDVPVRPYVRSELLDLMSSVWQAWETIDIAQARWYPYWTSEDAPVTSAAPDVLVSTHVGPGGALVIATNNGTASTDVQLDLSPSRLGFGDREFSITDLLRGVGVTPDADRTVHMDVPAGEAAVLLLTPAG